MMKTKEKLISNEGWLYAKPKKNYYGLETCAISVEPINFLLAASQVIEQNDIIKATSQDLAPDVNFSDTDDFKVVWE